MRITFGLTGTSIPVSKKNQNMPGSTWRDHRNVQGNRSRSVRSSARSARSFTNGNTGPMVQSRLGAVFGRRKPNITGAVRVTDSTVAPTRNLGRRFAFASGILAIGAGVFANTGGTPEPTNGRFKQILMTAAPEMPTIPSFRFDDADSAISSARQDVAEKSAASSTAMTLAQSRPDNSTGFPAQALMANIDAEHQASEKLPVQNPLPPLPDAISAGLISPQELSPASEQPGLQENYIKTVEIASGDTLSGVLNDNGVPSSEMQDILKDKLVRKFLTPLSIGDKLDFEYRFDGELDNVSVKIAMDTRIRFIPSEKGYMTRKENIPIEYERVVSSGTIDQSLYIAAERARLKQSTIMELADIFQWELDFSRDIRKGDSFSIVYDRMYRDGKYLGDGNILAARFTRGDRVHSAIRYEFPDGSVQYFSPDGQNKRKSFMRHPVDVVRITSKFDPNRMHPVLHKIRAHKGVDYGAPIGSPIYAVADGKVQFSGKRSTYGNTVVLEHGEGRTTLYAHMSKINADTKTGTRVQRGDIIGYVGKTGRVTGAHLHYEFRIAGKHVDPLKVKLPSGRPLKAEHLPQLKQMSSELFAQMDSVIPQDDNSRVAMTNY